MPFEALVPGEVGLRMRVFPTWTALWRQQDGELGAQRIEVESAALGRQVEVAVTQLREGSQPTLGAELASLFAQALRGLPAGAPLALIVDGPLRSLPWGALPGPEGPALALSHSLRLLPSALWLPVGAPMGQSLVVADPRGDLPQARAEGERLAARLPQSTLLAGPQASRSGTLAVLSSAGHLHIAGHGRVEPWEPYEAHLALSDGGRLTLMDLYEGRLTGHPTVVLSACEVGNTTPGGGAQGLTEGFLAAGASGVIAPLWPVEDGLAAALSERLYDHLATGLGLCSALGEAQADLARHETYSSPNAWGAFMCFGGGVPPSLSPSDPEVK